MANGRITLYTMPHVQHVIVKAGCKNFSQCINNFQLTEIPLKYMDSLIIVKTVDIRIMLLNLIKHSYIQL